MTSVLMIYFRELMAEMQKKVENVDTRSFRIDHMTDIFVSSFQYYAKTRKVFADRKMADERLIHSINSMTYSHSYPNEPSDTIIQTPEDMESNEENKNDSDPLKSKSDYSTEDLLLHSHYALITMIDSITYDFT